MTKRRVFVIMPLCPNCREDINPDVHSENADEPILVFVCPSCEVILGTQSNGTHIRSYGVEQPSLKVDASIDPSVEQSTVVRDTERRLNIFTRHVEMIVDRHDFSDLREEAIQVKVITPLVELLGWDRMTPEVEFEAWTGQGEGAGDPDYALCIEGEQRVLVEAKQTGIPLRKGENQLHGYLTVSSANWGILSNGKEYRIYEYNEKTESIETVVNTDYRNISTYAEQIAKISRESFER